MPGPQSQATPANAQDGSIPHKTFGAGVFFGSMCGGGIGLIAGVTKAFGNSALGFTAAFLLVGSSAFAGSVLLKTKKWSHVAICAMFYLVLPAMGVSLGLWPRRLRQFGALLFGRFLVAGVVLQATAYARITKGGTMVGIHACLVRWWCITEVVPAVAALLLLC